MKEDSSCGAKHEEAAASTGGDIIFFICRGIGRYSPEIPVENGDALGAGPEHAAGVGCIAIPGMLIDGSMGVCDIALVIQAGHPPGPRLCGEGRRAKFAKGARLGRSGGRTVGEALADIMLFIARDVLVLSWWLGR